MGRLLVFPVERARRPAPAPLTPASVAAEVAEIKAEFSLRVRAIECSLLVLRPAALPPIAEGGVDPLDRWAARELRASEVRVIRADLRGRGDDGPDGSAA